RTGDFVQAVEVLKAGNVREIDYGRVNGKYFINVAGAGFDAEVTNTATTWGKKHFSGSMAYIASILKELIAYSPKELHIEADGRSFTTKAWLVAVANGRYFGGGLMITPEADPEDGLFDVCIVGETTKLGFLSPLLKAYSGKHVGHPAVSFFRAAKIKISSDSKINTEGDGELTGFLPQEFSIVDGKIKILLP
ncbi:MAG: YegS/Rv2252/BmrU family lipid kinase, partial [bacterium]|nr:YegS/Rv2252/BmrU family lipid kinase [bacterium]